MSDILQDQFELYEQCILSGQVPQEDVPALLNANPEFAKFYLENLRNRTKEAPEQHR